MGVKESLPRTLWPSWHRQRARPFGGSVALARTRGRVAGRYAGLGGRQRRFYARLDRGAGDKLPDLSTGAPRIGCLLSPPGERFAANLDAPLVKTFSR